MLHTVKIIICFRDLREDATDDLLQAYYERYCEKLACPDEEPTFQELQEDYRISLQIVAIQVYIFFFSLTIY